MKGQKPGTVNVREETPRNFFLFKGRKSLGTFVYVREETLKELLSM